jgi:hypothetical protein
LIIGNRWDSVSGKEQKYKLSLSPTGEWYTAKEIQSQGVSIRAVRQAAPAAEQ